MAPLVFNSSEILFFEDYVKPGTEFPKPGQANGFLSKHFNQDFTLQFRNEAFPHIHVTDLRWNTGSEVEMHVDTPRNTVNINFHMAGKLDTRFSDIADELNMRPLKHNLIFSPEGSNVNRMQRNNEIEMLHISIDGHFFAQAIGCEDAWSERLQQSLASGKSFRAVPGTLDVTPAMFRLIREIRENQFTGPMRHLMMQSKVLELLAYQIDQMRQTVRRHEEVPHYDAEKLHQLKLYLDANFLSELSLATLSRMFALNEFKVKKGFRLLFGTSVFNYVRKLRMDYAGQLLRNTALTIEEVADILRYEHPQHFSIAFKKYAGCTPSRYQGKK